MEPRLSEKLKERLRDPETGTWRYLWLLLFYPFYITSFFLLEKLPMNFHVVECSLDHLIPFCEWFVIPYVLWHGAIGLLSIYLLFFDIPNLKKLIRFFLITYVITLAVYLIWPTSQELRPAVFPRQNTFTWLTEHVIYGADTSTNVCPSMHIIGTIGLWCAATRSPRFTGPLAKTLWFLLCLAICLSTVFLKQHSLIDIVAALPVALIGWLPVFGRRKRAEDGKR